MKRHAPAASRNAEPIGKVLENELPSAGTVLEIASGTGEHAVYLARRFPALKWIPSDIDPGALSSVDAYAAEAALDNLLPSVQLDACEADWPIESADAILCVNMVHIAPWDAAVGLFRHSARLLPSGGPLILYGPYFERGEPAAPSNTAFDESLRRRDPRWGLRFVEELDALGSEVGLVRAARYEMPANNLLLVYRLP